ncbi:MAG: PrsW family intramembrane metalloprotease [Chloroflexaceae bacterium]|nr:PrsW family intramembrane metalloprotease [Chloroflexaceae bacterium]NJO05723.1 PrsW family intramembrane metalloprotease [Chloroflexaceae bacterium]
MGAFLVAVLLSFVPGLLYAWVLYWLDRYEKEPSRLLIGVFLWGAIVAVIGALFFGIIFELGIFFLTGSEALTSFAGTAIGAPLVEESLKGLAVFIIFLFFRDEFDSVLDGIVYAGVTALGFAATENVLYLYFQGYLVDGFEGMLTLFFLRVVLGAWGHAFYTVFIGIGFAITRLNRDVLVKLAAPVIGWGIAVFVHGLHNSMVLLLAVPFGLGGLLATLLVDWTGWAMMFFVILWATARERHWLTKYLHEEVQNGIITEKQYQTAVSAWAQSAARFRSIFRGRLGTTRHFYHLCAELAQRKHQLYDLHEVDGTPAKIEELRRELARLSPLV